MAAQTQRRREALAVAGTCALQTIRVLDTLRSTLSCREKVSKDWQAVIGEAGKQQSAKGSVLGTGAPPAALGAPDLVRVTYDVRTRGSAG